MLGNSNAWHNILTWVMGALGLLTAIALWAGCTQLPNGNLDCSASTMIPPTWLPVISIILAAIPWIKSLMNLMRDGPGGLFKPQPPVADATATVTTPIVVAGTKQAEEAAKAQAAKPR